MTAARSKQYCEQVRNAQARLQSAAAILGQGRPASKDAGSETLAWVLGADAAKVRRSLPIFWAVILELIASLCMREAFASLRPDAVQASHRSAKSREESLQPIAAFREQVFAGAPLLGIAGPFNFQKMPDPQRGAMNDNMPMAAYA